MRKGQTFAIVGGVGIVLLALLTVFAIELTNTQAGSRRDVENRFHERARLAGALTDALFQTAAEQGRANDAQLYGGPAVSTRALDAAARQGHLAYVAVLDPSARVLGASSGISPAVRARLGSSPAVVTQGLRRGYWLGDLEPFGPHGTGVYEFAQSFPAKGRGTRLLLTAFAPSLLQGFVSGYLREVPNVNSGDAYVLDAHGDVVGSRNPRIRSGARVGEPGLVAAIGRGTQGPFGSGRYFTAAPVGNSTWRVVLTAPASKLFASVTGVRKWVPWIIFLCFALAASFGVVLLRRLLGASAAVADANEKLAEANGELERTNRVLERRATELVRSNAELEQFASVASHDLQEPLRKVQTFAEQVTVREADALSDQGRDYLRRMSAAAARMQDLIDDLLRFSRVATHARPFVDVDLSAIAHEVLGDLESSIEASQAHVRVGDLPHLSADPLQMRQLLQNLISNALKFRREGIAPEIEVSARTGEATMQLVVRDNGIGFDPQYSTRIFRVFERLHGRGTYAGTGIGLALCRKIIERHGGHIEAHGIPGEGSVFTVTLPLRHEDFESMSSLPASMLPTAESERPLAHV